MLDNEPSSVSSTLASKERNQWLDTMNKEMKSLHLNKMWTLVLGLWILGWLVVNGFTNVKMVLQKLVNENSRRDWWLEALLREKEFIIMMCFLFLVKHKSIQMLLVMVVELNLESEQMDVKTAFLYRDLEETIYMKQLEGFKVRDKEDYVC